MKKYLVSLILLSAGISHSISVQDILGNSAGGSVGSWLGDAIVKVQNPNAVLDQGSAFYYGGGMSVRFPRRTFQPFSITPPSLSIGCGGIDFTFGSFSYLQDPQYLVEFGKSVLQGGAVAAMAFKTAIQIFCPTCEDILTKLENLANLVNSMQLDSCQLAQYASNYVKDKLGSAIASKKTESGQRDFYFEELDKLTKRADAMLKDFVNSGLERSEVVRVIASLPPGKYSIVDDIMPRLKSGSIYKLGSSQLVNDAQLRKAMKSFFGDVIIDKPDKKAEITLSVVAPCVEEPEVKDLIIYGETNTCETINLKLGGRSIYGRINSYVQDIIDRIETHQPLTTTQLEFLAMFPFPAYKLLNTLSISPSALQTTGSNLAEYFAFELSQLIFLDYIRAYTHTLISLKNSDLFIDNEGAQELLNVAIANKNRNISAIIESIDLYKQEKEKQLKKGLDIVKAYEQQSAKLLGGDPAYQSVMWSQVYGVRAR